MKTAQVEVGGPVVAIAGEQAAGLAQFGFVALTLLVPGLCGLARDLPLLLQQLVLATQASQFGLLVDLDLTDLGQLGPAGIELREHTGLAELCVFQAFLQQRLFALFAGQPALQ